MFMDLVFGWQQREYIHCVLESADLIAHGFAVEPNDYPMAQAG